MTVVTIIDLLPITIIDASRGLRTAGVQVASSLCFRWSFHSLLSLSSPLCFGCCEHRPESRPCLS